MPEEASGGKRWSVFDGKEAGKRCRGSDEKENMRVLEKWIGLVGALKVFYPHETGESRSSNAPFGSIFGIWMYWETNDWMTGLRPLSGEHSPLLHYQHSWKLNSRHFHTHPPKLEISCNKLPPRVLRFRGKNTKTLSQETFALIAASNSKYLSCQEGRLAPPWLRDQLCNGIRISCHAFVADKKKLDGAAERCEEWASR